MPTTSIVKKKCDDGSLEKNSVIMAATLREKSEDGTKWHVRLTDRIELVYGKNVTLSTRLDRPCQSERVFLRRPKV
jgi:hypothetical protein